MKGMGKKRRSFAPTLWKESQRVGHPPKAPRAKTARWAPKLISMINAWKTERRERWFRSLLESKQLSGIVRLPGDVCGDDYGFGLFVVLGQADFRAASGEFASLGISDNPNLAEEIVSTHSFENELAVFRRCGTSASV